MPTTPNAAFQPQCAAITPPSITPSTEPTEADGEEPASSAPRMRAGKWLAISAGADRAVARLAQADDGARGEQLRRSCA